MTWTGLAKTLRNAARCDIRNCTEPAITSLFLYARPDAVVSIGPQPLVSIEQTMMNPSGHNLPQRFSCFVRAAETGVSGIFYYPAVSRRTHSDPNVRYLNIRVPLAQFCLMDTFDVPSLSVFWPTGENRLPSTAKIAQQNLADLVDETLDAWHQGRPLTASYLSTLKAHANALSAMDDAINAYGSRYAKNASVRALMPNGFPRARRGAPASIDPPGKCELFPYARLFQMLETHYPNKTANWDKQRNRLSQREYALLFSGTANKNRTGSEHPWPGYLSLLDTLYCRGAHGRSTDQRNVSLVYRLPNVSEQAYSRGCQSNMTDIRIVSIFADLVLLDDAVFRSSEVLLRR